MRESKMNRRAALRTMFYIAGGTMILPACFRESGSKTIALKNLTISEQQELILAEIGETLIPVSDTPGAKELLLHLFVLKMVDDCHSPDDQRAFSEGLDAFSVMQDTLSGKTFMELPAKSRALFLMNIADQNTEEVKAFYSIIRNRCIQGYMNSKTVMTDMKKYELIPGRYNAYYKIG